MGATPPPPTPPGAGGQLMPPSLFGHNSHEPRHSNELAHSLALWAPFLILVNSNFLMECLLSKKKNHIGCNCQKYELVRWRICYSVTYPKKGLGHSESLLHETTNFVQQTALKKK